MTHYSLCRGVCGVYVYVYVYAHVHLVVGKYNASLLKGHIPHSLPFVSTECEMGSGMFYDS